MKVLEVGDGVRLVGSDPDDLGVIRAIGSDGFEIEWLNGTGTIPLDQRAELEYVPDDPAGAKARHIACIKYRVEFEVRARDRVGAVTLAWAEFDKLKEKEGWSAPENVNLMVWSKSGGTPNYWNARFYWDEETR